MSEENNLENQIIENYYSKRERPVTPKENPAQEDIANEFYKKLNIALNKMDTLESDIFDFDIDILRIIAEGEEKKRATKDRKEFFAFIGVAAIILSVIVLLTIFVNYNIYIYLQAAIFTLLPFSLIPLAGAVYSREDRV